MLRLRLLFIASVIVLSGLSNSFAQNSGTTSEVLTHLRPKNDGKPKIDPLFVKAIVGHMYVIHVVDENADFYALFRVDALNEGACNVSWKLIPAPPNQDE